jgi:serine/threonine protein kinase
MTGSAEVSIGRAPTVGGWLLGGRYRVQDRLGIGGMADVFRAQDEVLGRTVAAKVFRVPPPDVEAVCERERQQTELRALAALNHPNLVTLYDGSATAEPPFLVMELIDGPTLSAELARGPLAEPHARALAIQIADALAYVHARGMIHRDVKPANILLGAEDSAGEPAWRARLTDFGIVRIAGNERLTSANLALGSPSYLAPEQARGFDVGPAADIYSLGLVLIEALTGRRSFDGPVLETVAARLVRGPEIPADLPAPWPALLASMTATDPEARPSAVQIALELRRPDAATVPLAAVPLAAVPSGGVPSGGVPSGGVPSGGVPSGGVPGGAVPLAAVPLAAVPLEAESLPTTVVPVISQPDADEPDDERAGRWHHTGLVAAALACVLVAGAVLLMNAGWSGAGKSDQLPPITGQSASSLSSTSAVPAPKVAAASSAAIHHTAAPPASHAATKAARVVTHPPTRPPTVPSPSSSAPVSPSPTPSSNSQVSPSGTPTSVPSSSAPASGGPQ